MSKFKEFLKKYLPASSKTFMYEINRVSDELRVTQNMINQCCNRLDNISGELAAIKTETALCVASTSAICEESKKAIEELSSVRSEVDKIKEDISFFSSINKNEEKINELSKSLAVQQNVVDERLNKLSDTLNSQMDAIEQLKEQRSLLEEIKTEASGARSKAIYSANTSQEAVWANVFHDTIQNSSWLYNKTFSPGRWAVGYQFLYVMYRVLNDIHPHSILELGLGQSTNMCSQYTKANSDISHIVIEHDTNWIDFYRRSNPLPVETEIMLLEREMKTFKDISVRCFKDFKEKLSDKKYDFIIVDAPYSADMKQYARIDILSIIPECLNNNFVIMFDDCHRPGEKRTVAELEKKLNDNNIRFKKGIYSGAKECVLFCSEDIGFLATL